jgi:hypothetical protein
VDRQIILTAQDLAVISVVLAAIVGLFGLLGGGRLLSYLIRRPTGSKEMTVYEKIIFFFFCSLSSIAGLVGTTYLLLGHSEKGEWLVYELASVIIFITAAVMSGKNFRIESKLGKLSVVFCYFILLTQIIFLTFYLRWT